MFARVSCSATSGSQKQYQGTGMHTGCVQSLAVTGEHKSPTCVQSNVEFNPLRCQQAAQRWDQCAHCPALQILCFTTGTGSASDARKSWESLDEPPVESHSSRH